MMLVSGAGRAPGLIGALADVMVIKGVPEHLRSDNGPEFVAGDLPSADQLALFSQIVANWRPMAIAAAFDRAERWLKFWPKPADLIELIVEPEVEATRLQRPFDL